MNEESLNDIKQMDWGNLKSSQIVAINNLFERVQELEGKLDRIRFVNNDYDKQNKRYREALEFYANKDTWELGDPYEPRDCEVWRDYGDVARKALEGEE